MFSIEVKDLKKSYGNLKAVDGISFTVKPGEVFGLLGPNGAGKTTTIEIMEGLRERDSGEVKILGLDPWKDGYEVHKKIGVIPQEFTFFEKTTPKEAINYYASLFNVKVNADAILKEVLLDEMEMHVFESLSGGQKQKTGLALSLVNSPELLFLDEPTTGLDPNARRAIWEVIRRLKTKGKTIILTTHYLDEAQQLSDRVAIMDHGHIVAMGTMEEIIQKHGSGERLDIHGSQQLADYINANTELQGEYDKTREIITIPLKKKIDMLAALAAAEQSGMEWGEIQTRQDNLDDIFIKLVNDTLGEPDEEERTQKTNKKGRS
ncbi:MAG: ABC transporter ATP-binding protein [Nitrososphaerota archaeon]|jgi:ABC-2 type transport system ATP-binding protein|nr:ABC transporter ATP-binding protein [Nitrososphaerota archaeon]